MISKERLLDLLKKEDELDALQAAGVDNWCGWGEHTEFMNMDLQDSDVLPKEYYNECTSETLGGIPGVWDEHSH